MNSSIKLLSCFRDPPPGWGLVPFYWWAGERLDQERVAWQLDHLCMKGVLQTVVSYPHCAEGSTDTGDPPLFSPAWWDFFRWFLGQCRMRGMTVGVQDYTLTQPILREIGRVTPDMEGGQLSCVWARMSSGESVTLNSESGSKVVCAWAYPSISNKQRPISNVQQSTSNVSHSTFHIQPSTGFTPEGAIDVGGYVRDGALTWEAPEGEWLVALVFARINAFDPLHSDSGRLAIERLYTPFERECPGEVGQTLTLFFQDELDFGSHMPFWSNRLFEVFCKAQGYELSPLLPALWLDLGAITEKVRLDFADTVVARIEACYFEPVYRWHEAHGTLFGHDNNGRGKLASGRLYYGDTFRTMRWYSAPGCDDPKLAMPRAFKGLKVNSSIAHLYRRPRVWVEAFHSSGWGTTPTEVVAALNEDFAYGATVVNLHGLYYSTRGGWWEWAAPDFHFRQPYWGHIQALNSYCTRLSWLLSQGTHRCDVAILYPIAALHTQPENPLGQSVVVHVENDRDTGTESDDPQPEASAFGLGKYLFNHTCDFDFIDDDSVARATTHKGELRAAGEAYRVLILPAISAVRFTTLKKVRDFVHAGGTVIAYGRLPCASERAGRNDPQLAELLEEVFGVSCSAGVMQLKQHPAGGCGVFIPHGYSEVLRVINERIVRDVSSSAAPLHVLHRRLDTGDFYYLSNPSDAPVETLLNLRAAGSAETWDAWTGATAPLPLIKSESGISTLQLALGPKEAKIVVFAGKRQRMASAGQNLKSKIANPKSQILPDGPWEFTLKPTLDNRFGDFRLPASEGCLGPEARRFRTAEEIMPQVNRHEADFDDSAWPETTYSFGSRFESLGPLLPGADTPALEARLAAGELVEGLWQPYAFSLRWGIEHDPFLTDWLSGPHGLKGQVPDEYLDFQCDTPGSVWYLRTEIISETEREVPFVMGGRCAYCAWLNGRPVVEQTVALPPGRYVPWDIPHYTCEPQIVHVTLQAGVNRLLLKLIQPEGQRTRAFAAFDTAAPDLNELGLRWFRDPHALRPSLPAGAERRAIWFRGLAPCGLQEINFVARGNARVWAEGREVAVEVISPLSGGCVRYRATVAKVSRQPVTIALRVEAPPESRAGDALPEPVSFLCGAGEMPLGDWCAYGLATYSGAGEYTTTFVADEIEPGERFVLELGDVAATAEVRVNGQLAATLVAPPWRVEITELVRPGTNRVAICVANTLANHYSVGIPTPYAFPEQTRSGLFGPVRIMRGQENDE